MHCTRTAALCSENLVLGEKCKELKFHSILQDLQVISIQYLFNIPVGGLLRIAVVTDYNETRRRRGDCFLKSFCIPNLMTHDS